MGSKQFQKEYIEYLEEKNNELLNKLTHMKENYENKIFSKDLNKLFLTSAIEDMLNVCVIIPQEIDLFFDKMTSAMNVLKSILLRKSEMMQLVEKISKTMNLADTLNSDLAKEQNTETRLGKKAGTAKVSPMINGHIITTEPRICLNRISKNFTPNRRNESHKLSPIIEASPDTSRSSITAHVCKELRIPLERINLNKLSYSYGREESPKSRFKGPKTWKKSLTTNKHQPEIQSSKVLESSECLNKKRETEENKETSHRKMSVRGSNDSENKNKETEGEMEGKIDADPLEGPSWLYNENPESSESSSPSGNVSTHFVDYMRRKHRFATVFDRNEDFISVRCSEEKGEVPQEESQLGGTSGEINDKSDDSKLLNKTGDASEDLIGESLNEQESAASPLQKRNSPGTRNCVQECGCEIRFADFEEDAGKVGSTPCSTSKKENTPVKSDSLYEADSEDCPSGRKRRRSFKKHLTRSMFDSVSMDTSDKTPTGTGPSEQEIQTSIKNKRTNSKPKVGEMSSKTKEDHEKGESDKSEQCGPVRPGSAGEKKASTSRSDSKCWSPSILQWESGGRQKRRAAPVCLAEPKLNTKLRRK